MCTVLDSVGFEPLVSSIHRKHNLLQYLNKPDLHIVDTTTDFENAIFIRCKSAEDLWQYFITCWGSVFSGFLKVFLLDRETSFTYEKIRNNAKDLGITLQFSGIESHNAIGQGERCHYPLSRIFKITSEEHPLLKNPQILRVSAKPIYENTVPDDLVPSLLVFGVLPTFPWPNTKPLFQSEQFKYFKTARAEMETIVAEKRIRRALKSKIPPTTKYLIKPGDQLRFIARIRANGKVPS